MNEYGVEMIPVSSSNVQEIGYDETNQTLYVRFNNSRLYVYQGVPIAEYCGLRDAGSVGSYLNINIKGNYPYQQLE